jgi:ArsR family transcriptional regulator
MSPIGLTFKALGDPNRRKVVRLLVQNDMTAGEIAEHFNMTKPTISHHLSVLKQAGIVSDEKQGQYIYYSLNATVFQELVGWLMEFTKGGMKNEVDK